MPDDFVHEHRSYEIFDEFPGKHGVRQNILSTIEFGISAFVPLSKRFIMYYGAVGEKGGFGVHASDGGLDKVVAELEEEFGFEGAQQAMPKKVVSWANRLQAYGLPMGPGQSLTRDLQEVPATAKSEAQRLSEKITKLLEREGMVSEFDSTVRGELEEQAVAMMLRSEFPSGWRAQPDPVGNISIVNTDHIRRLGGETFDLYAQTQQSADVLEYNLHMIARHLGPEFVAGVGAMETTNMTTRKYFQNRMRESEHWGINNNAAWVEGVADSIQDMKDEWDFATQGFEDVFDEIGPQVMSEDGPESLDYFARQMLNRFGEIEGGQFGDAYIFHAPIDKYSAGYAMIRPVISNGFLTDVEWRAGVIGGPFNPDGSLSGGQTLKDIAGPGGPMRGAMSEVGSARSYASNSQIMMWDAYTLHNMNAAQLETLLGPTYQTAANDLALKSQRGEVIGGALNTELAVSLGSVVGGAGVVQGVEVLGTTESTDLIREQIEYFMKDKSLETQMAKFYQDAMDASEDVTATWRSSVGGGAYTVAGNPKAGIWANEGGPFIDEQNLEGVGTPFYFMIGRDPTGFEKFKGQETHKPDKMAGAVLGGKPAEARQWQEHLDAGGPRPTHDMKAPGLLQQFPEGETGLQRATVWDPRKNWITDWAATPKTRKDHKNSEGFGEGNIEDIFNRDREESIHGNVTDQQSWGH